MKLVFGSFLIAAVAYWLARGIGIPHWRDGFSWSVVGDASDIGVSTFIGVLLLALWFKQ